MKGLIKLRAVVEIDQEKFVLRIRRAEKLAGGEARLLDFVAHAAAHVENHADGNRDVLARKINDFLLDAVFEDSEIFLLEPGNDAVHRIGNGHIYER